MKKDAKLTYNIAIIISFTILFFLELLFSNVIKEKYEAKYILSRIIAGISTLAIFNLVILVIEKYFWKFFSGRPNLCGMWVVIYSNSDDADTQRYSMVEINENLECFELTGENYKEGVENFHSTWKSTSCRTEGNQFIYDYQVTSIGREIKLGTTVLNFRKDRFPKILKGTYADASPESNQGSIVFRKIRKKDYKKYVENNSKIHFNPRKILETLYPKA